MLDKGAGVAGRVFCSRIEFIPQPTLAEVEDWEKRARRGSMMASVHSFDLGAEGGHATLSSVLQKRRTPTLPGRSIKPGPSPPPAVLERKRSSTHFRSPVVRTLLRFANLTGGAFESSTLHPRMQDHDQSARSKRRSRTPGHSANASPKAGLRRNTGSGGVDESLRSPLSGRSGTVQTVNAIMGSFSSSSGDIDTGSPASLRNNNHNQANALNRPELAHGRGAQPADSTVAGSDEFSEEAVTDVSVVL